MRRPIVLMAAAAALAALAAAAVIHVVPMVKERRANVALGKRWKAMLVAHSGFSGSGPPQTGVLSFTYAAPTDENLTRLRETYRLDAIAGAGSETDRIIRLMAWVYGLTGHANEPRFPKELNALSLIPLAREKHMQMNCAMKTIILNEVYLAMGWPSRQTHLLPFEKEEEESHYVTSVYAATLGRWILMDPDFGLYLTDERGEILGVREMRRRLITGQPLVERPVQDEGPVASAREEWRNLLRGVSYRWFLTEFAFKIRCPDRSLFNQRAEPVRVYVELLPDGYREDLLSAPEITGDGRRILYINDEDLFWQKP